MKITIAGCGNMGLIYARAFLKYNIVSKENLFLAEKNEQRRDVLKEMQTGIVTTVNDPAISESDIIILAVKPQDFDDLATSLKSVVTDKNLLVSIMAGITMKYISEKLNNDRVVRAMPNSAAEFGMGITGYTCSPKLSMEEVHKADNLLATTGRIIFFENEDMLNAVTALSGSGPAYFFYVLKNMIEAGMKMGMTENVATTLVKQTMLGSFHLINDQGKSLDDLIKAVASKGGTTEAAFKIFEQENIGSNLQKGILRASERAKELAK
ncbi:MAG: pyrroline-5-carboxylate reductase [Bacteroidota bacterium]